MASYGFKMRCTQVLKSCTFWKRINSALPVGTVLDIILLFIKISPMYCLAYQTWPIEKWAWGVRHNQFSVRDGFGRGVRNSESSYTRPYFDSWIPESVQESVNQNPSNPVLYRTQEEDQTAFSHASSSNIFHESVWLVRVETVRMGKWKIRVYCPWFNCRFKSGQNRSNRFESVNLCRNPWMILEIQIFVHSV